MFCIGRLSNPGPHECMTQTVSVLLPISSDNVGATAIMTRVLRQSHAALELLVVAPERLAPEIPETCRHIVRDPRESLGTAMNRALRQSTGQMILHADVAAPWAPDHVERVLEIARGASARLVVATSGAARGPVLDLASLCVENIVAPGSVAYTRDLLEETGLFDESLAEGAEWELWLRMMRCAEPVMMPSSGMAVAGLREEASLVDRLNTLLTMLRIHVRAADLARELPGTANRQWAARRACATHALAAMTPPLVDGGYVSCVLGRIAHAALRLGDARDVDAAVALIEHFFEHGNDDSALQRTRLQLLRALGRPDQIMLALGEMTDTSHPEVLRELSFALRQLGQLDDAAAVESMLTGSSLEVAGVPDDVVEIPSLGRQQPIAPAWPAWIPRGTADGATWARAAHAYAVAGLPTAARAAMQRAVRAGHAVSADDASIRTLIDVDRALAERLADAPSPLVPIRRVSDGAHGAAENGARPLFLPLSANDLERGPFQATLADEVFTDHEQLAVRQFLASLLDADTTLVDVGPSTLASPVSILASVSGVRRYVVIVNDEEQVRRAELAIAENGVSSCGVVTSDAAVALGEIERGVGPLVIHVRLGMASEPLVAALVESVRRSRRSVQLVWSETASSSVTSHPAFPSVEAVAERLGLRLSGVSTSDGALCRRPLEGDPRPQLLHGSTNDGRTS